MPCVPRLNHCRIAVGLSIMAAILLAAAAARGATPVRTGAHVLHDSGYRLLAGKRVGLITNQTGRVGDVHLIDLLQREKTVRLTALFAPEHGLRGEAEDGVAIREGRDARTGVPVHSLYGAAKKPTPAMLRAIDLLLFDIQDIGVRFYTYIATLGLAMQAAAEAGIPLVVLDRPNPLGGEYVAGFVLEPAFASFTGLYPIPVAHGLTVGELARLIKGERLLPGLERLDLQVVPMSGWHREMCWPATGLPWVATSPNIPDFITALLYAGVGFFEGTSVSEGRGTVAPFQLVGAPGLPAAGLAARLSAAGLPGVVITPAEFTPRSLPGRSSSPKYRDRPLPGLRLQVADPQVIRPVELAIHLLSACYQAISAAEQARFFKPPGFDRLAGSDRLRRALTNGLAPTAIIASWEAEVARFRATRQPYLLY